jgi:hypothetical protein
VRLMQKGGSGRFTQKNFGTRRSIFVCCTEDIYKFVSCTDPFESSPWGTRSDSTVTGKYLFVTRRLRHFEPGGVVQTLRYGIFLFSLSHQNNKNEIERFVMFNGWLIGRK